MANISGHKVAADHQLTSHTRASHYIKKKKKKNKNTHNFYFELASIVLIQMAAS